MHISQGQWVNSLGLKNAIHLPNEQHYHEGSIPRFQASNNNNWAQVTDSGTVIFHPAVCVCTRPTDKKLIRLIYLLL